MDPKLDLAKVATCTTCQFKENKSNYWTAVLFFKHQNGSFARVPQMANFGTGTPNGGMTVYYVQNEAKGFRMITGNPMLRSEDTKNVPKVTSFRCFGPNWQDSNPGQPPGGGTDTVELPNKPCGGGIRSNTNFPQCWDGVNLDSPDHASHIVHPPAPLDPNSGLTFYRGRCPASHPVRMPLLLFETIWDTRQFNNMWPTDGSQPFLYSMGDPTGYGHHGDYVFGWEGDALQRAMDTCTEFNGVPSYCKTLTIQPDSEINKCTLKPVLQEQIDGFMERLPGCNPIQDGPRDATMAECLPAPTGVAEPAGPAPPAPTPA
ncbi:hypothetical protein FA15DRAFT_682808 [Coprinopsis marcescibilis]|uniref:DUF1996 domain-containing protein n=1 Tax=Coprinopsis marcescibilis TaxID=230819 RepID=A0A5C3KI53_COPMA|nr:hypothetical protein FA15DRAFT_682808 [Coprinopsis marcescibilis]